jgi:hypothetical protein
MHDGDKNALDFFVPGEIGDTDNGGTGDGHLEILDGWRRPIMFLRWAPGYIGPVSLHNAGNADPFDPTREDRRSTYALHPLIFSGGKDELYDINVGNPVFSTMFSPNDPYCQGFAIGAPADADGDGDLSFTDNITNHYQPTN